MLTYKSIICQSKDIDSTDLNGDKVMMNLEKGKYFALNSIGSRIWDAIEDEISIGQVISQLLEEYDVEEEVCKNTVLSFVDKLKNEGLITID